MAFTFDTTDKKCCLHKNLKDLKIGDESTATFLKKAVNYTFSKLGDRDSDYSIKTPYNAEISKCATDCTDTKDCIGFSYGDGKCSLRAGRALSDRYTVTGKQFYNRTFPSNLPKCRYVVFKQTGPSQYVITTPEIQVYDKNGKNIALNRGVTTTTTHGSYSGQNAVDGDLSTIWHSAHSGSERSIKIDLGSEQEITFIDVWNVLGDTVYNGVTVGARMSAGGPGTSDKGAWIELLDASGNVVLTSKDIKHVSGLYTLDFTKSNDTWL
jgi:hypothetical protein